MPSEKIGDIYVPAEGPESTKIMIVGEAPGADEETHKRPFIGKAGDLQNRVLQRYGLQRHEVWFTNLSKYRPFKNKFKYLLESEELARGLMELELEINKVKPNLIIAAGGWPLYYLAGKTGKKNAPGSGITLWRGSVLPCTLVEGYKVYASFHPSYINRVPSNAVIYNDDIRRAIKEAEFPDYRPPVYESIIDPSDDIIENIVKEFSEAEWLSVDIETWGEELACIGFADSGSRGLCLTALKPDAWTYAKMLLTSPAKKIFQYGHSFDVPWLDHFYGWKVNNFAFDTYMAAATLMPEFSKGLDFLTSIYTNFPYYKEEGRGKNAEWKREGDFNILWNYNIKDVLVTYIIAMEQMKELKEKFE